MDTVKNMFEYFTAQVRSIRLNDVIDILVVAVVLYYIFKFVRNRRASRLAVGIGLLFLLYLVSDAFDLNTIKFVVGSIFQVGLIAFIIVFQPEFRSMLESFGGQTKKLRAFSRADKTQSDLVIQAVVDASCDLSRDKTGALMVIERETPLGDYIKSGSVINADVTPILLRNLFFNKSPLHDGAVIIKDCRIHAAGCFLPLSMNSELMKELGTRHRAAIGLSENSDAAVVVVSEETGTISVAYRGELKRGFDRESLKSYLGGLLGDENLAAAINRRAAKKAKKDKEKKADETDENED